MYALTYIPPEVMVEVAVDGSDPSENEEGKSAIAIHTQPFQYDTNNFTVH